MTTDDYVRFVGFELRDLPYGMRRDLLADLRRHLEETGVEELGSPETYAKELRESAGLESRRGPIAWLRARRPRNVVFSAVLIAVGGLVVAALVWINSYQPLRFAYGTVTPDNVRTDVPDRDVVTFHDGGPFSFGITVQNSGRFTVRIEGVPLIEPNEILPFSGRVFMSGVLKNGGVYPPYVPFHPFDLKPGQVRLLFIRGVYAHCHDYGGGSGVVFDSFPVTFSFLWRTERVRIPLARPRW